MKIGVVVPHLKKYGGIRRYLEFGNQLVKKGHEYRLYVIDMSEEYPWIDELNFQGKICYIGDLLYNDLDACIIGDAGSLSYLDKSKATLKIVNIIFPMFSSYLLGDYASYVGRDDLLVVGNGSGWEGLLHTKPNWKTIPGAVNLEMFKPCVKSIIDDKFRILFMAKNRPWKGTDKIIEVYHQISRLSDGGIEWHYFDTEPHPELPREMLGHVDIPQTLMAAPYSSCDCYCSMEELAGWQNCAAEAMSCGCPVITTQIGAVDFAHHNRTAIIVETVEELVSGILLLKKSVKMRRRLSKAGLEVIQNFSWEKYADRWIGLLTSELILREEIIIGKQKVLRPVEVLEDADAFKQIVDKANRVSNDLDIRPDAILLPIPQEEKLVQSQSGQMDAIRAKAAEIKKLYTPTRRRDMPIFDKYERFGAYHWNSPEKDPPYHDYVNLLKKIFKGVADLYGRKEVLDVGGGDGFIAGQLCHLGFPVRLIDTNATAIKLAKEKLKDYSNIIIEKQDFFSLSETPSYMLLSHVIEHFEDPGIVVEKIRQCQPEIVLISTPIHKKDGLWDPDYHMVEYTEDEFIGLFKPLINEYQISHTCLKPFNQILFLERKITSIERYFESLVDQVFDEGIHGQTLGVLGEILSTVVKRN